MGQAGIFGILLPRLFMGAFGPIIGVEEQAQTIDGVEQFVEIVRVLEGSPVVFNDHLDTLVARLGDDVLVALDDNVDDLFGALFATTSVDTYLGRAQVFTDVDPAVGPLAVSGALLGGRCVDMGAIDSDAAKG